MLNPTSKRYFVLFFILIFPSFSYAQVEINEVFYSPQTKAWIELYNNSDSPVDLSTYKIIDAGAVVNGHSINSPAVIGAHSYAVIGTSGAVTNFGQVAYSLFQSALKPNTSGDTFILKDASKNTIDSKSFSSSDGANGDGNSLSKQSDGSWVSTTPTPGTDNTGGQTPVSNNNGDNSQSNSSTTSQVTYSNSLSSHTSYADVSLYKPPQNLLVTSGRDRLTTTSVKNEFVAESNIKSSSVFYHWSFGDGSSADGSRVEHIYDFPGDYVVVLNATYFGETSVSRAMVKVVEPSLAIEEANSEYIKIKNNSSFEVNLFGWKLFYRGVFFEFPMDTIILPNTSIEFSSRLTGFHPNDIGEVSLNTIRSQDLKTSSSIQVTHKPADKVAVLMEKAKSIQSELAKLEPINEPVVEPQNTNLTTAVLSIGSSTPKNQTGWFGKLKRFLLGD